MTSAVAALAIRFRGRGRMGACVVGALVVLAIPSAAAARVAPTAGQRAEVHRLLAPMTVFKRAVAPASSAVLQQVTATQAADNPCAQQARSGIDAARAAGKLSASDAAGTNGLVDLLAGIHVLQVVVKPLDAPLSAARRAYRTMRVDDPVLHRGARAQASQLSALLRFGRGRNVDFCGLMTRLAAVGFDLDLDFSVDLLDLLEPVTEVGDSKDQAAISRAQTRMRRLGAGPTSVRRFGDFPISALPPAVRKALEASLGDL